MITVLLIIIAWVTFCVLVYEYTFTKVVMVGAGLYAFLTLLSGCASSDVVYKKDCRMAPATKKCIEVPINPKHEGEGRH